MSDSVWPPHRWQPTKLPRPWDSPGKNTGVGCHFLLQCMKVKSESEVAQACPTLLDPMDCSLPGSLVHGILQARVLEWGAIAFSASSTISLISCEAGALNGSNWVRNNTELSTVSETTEHLHFHFSLSCTGEGNGNPLQCSCLENPRDGGAWRAAVYGVAQSQTRLERLSSSSSTIIYFFHSTKSLWGPEPNPHCS